MILVNIVIGENVLLIICAQLTQTDYMYPRFRLRKFWIKNVSDLKLKIQVLKKKMI